MSTGSSAECRSVTERTHRAGEAGFTLLEVLVAFAVLSVSLAAILAIYSTAFQSAARARSYAVATQLAEAKLNEVAVTGMLSEDVAGGILAEEYEWAAVISPLEWQEPDGGVEHPLKPYQVSVEVSWSEAGRERSVELHTVKLGRRP